MLLQEIYLKDPWKMLVGCILLNQTNRKQVDKVRDELFNRYPNPRDMMNADELDLAKLLKSLGFYNKRSKSLKRFSKEYLDGFRDVNELYGIGTYGSDSWEIFQNKNYDIKPTDKELKKYLEDRDVKI